MSKSLHTLSYPGASPAVRVADNAGSRFGMITPGGIPPRPFRIRYGA